MLPIKEEKEYYQLVINELCVSLLNNEKAGHFVKKPKRCELEIR